MSNLYNEIELLANIAIIVDFPPAAKEAEVLNRFLVEQTDE